MTLFTQESIVHDINEQSKKPIPEQLEDLKIAAANFMVSLYNFSERYIQESNSKQRSREQSSNDIWNITRTIKEIKS